jgi:hypothetical protein
MMEYESWFPSPLSLPDWYLSGMQNAAQDTHWEGTQAMTKEQMEEYAKLPHQPGTMFNPW